MSVETKVSKGLEDLARQVASKPIAWTRLESRIRRRHRFRVGIRVTLIIMIGAVAIVTPRLWSRDTETIIPVAPTADWKIHQHSYPRFSFMYPPLWRLQTFSERDTNRRGALVSNLSHNLKYPDVQGTRAAAWDFRGTPSGFVVVQIHEELGERTEVPSKANTAFPLSLDQANVRSPAAEERKYDVPEALVVPVILNGVNRFFVTVWLGPEASEHDREFARLVVASIGFSEASSEPRFDGTIHGWRIAPSPVIRREGLERQLELDCEPREVQGTEARTDLDFAAGFLPSDAHLTTFVKSICDEDGLSVSQWYRVGRSGLLRIERWLMDKRAFAVDAATRNVEPCDISGHPAVCVRPSREPVGESVVLVIEDDVLDPFATILVVIGEGVPYADLVRTASEVR